MAQKSTTPDYQALHDELEAILDKLQSGDITVDQALPAYERGMVVIRELETYLKTAENTVKQLQAQADSGQ